MKMNFHGVSKLSLVAGLSCSMGWPAVSEAGVVSGPGATATVNPGDVAEAWTVSSGGFLQVNPGGQTLQVQVNYPGTAAFDGATVRAPGVGIGLQAVGATVTVVNSDISSEGSSGINESEGANSRTILDIRDSRVSGFGQGIAMSVGTLVNMSGTQVTGNADGRTGPLRGGVGLGMIGSEANLSAGTSVVGANNGAVLVNSNTNPQPNTRAVLRLDASQVQGLSGAGVQVGNAQLRFPVIAVLSLANNSTLSGGNGVAVEVANATQLDLQAQDSRLEGGLSVVGASTVAATLNNTPLVGNVAVDQAVLNLTATGSELTGDYFFTNAAQVDLDLQGADGQGLINLDSASAGRFASQDGTWIGDMTVAGGSQLQWTLTRSALTGNLTLDDTSNGVMALDASTWTGDATGNTRIDLANASTLTGQLNTVGAVNLTGASVWNLTGSSQADSLAVDGSRVNLNGSAGSYRTLTLGSLSGNGVFGMNTDIGAGQGDLLVVTGGAEGTHELAIANSGLEPARGATLTVVETGGGAGTFAAIGGTVDVGTYMYELARRGADWVLVPALDDPGPGDPGPVDPGPVDPGPVDPGPVDPGPVDPGPVDPGPVDPGPVDPGPGNPGNGGGQPGGDRLTSSARSVLGLFSAAPTVWYGELATLRSRMGELRMGRGSSGPWVRSFGGQYNVTAGGGVAYKQRQQGVSFGIDTPLPTDSGQWMLGVMAGYSRSDLSLGRGTSGKVDSYFMGLYSTWLSEGGYYVDGVVKVNRFQNDSNVRMSDGTRSRGDYRHNGVGASVEVGRRMVLPDNWYVEPFAQVSALWTEGDNYRLDNGLQGRSNGADSLLGKVGAHVGRSFDLPGGGVVQPYVKLAVGQEFAKGNRVKVNNNAFNNDVSGGRGEVGVGVIAQVSSGLQLHVDLDYAQGDQFEQPWATSVGVRYAW